MHDRKPLPRSSSIAVWIAVLTFTTLVTSSVARAQENPTPRFELFGGYSWVNPGGHVFPNATQRILLPDYKAGWDESLTVNLSRFAGLTEDFGQHYRDSGQLSTLLFGPQLKYPGEHFSPFAHILLGLSSITPPNQDTVRGFGGAVGGGFDVTFTRHLAVRLFQADYLYQSYRHRVPGVEGQFNGVRIQGGPVFMWGQVGKPLPPPSASCSLQPTAVLAGEPVTATVQTQNFNPKHTLTYNWTSTGGKVQSKDTTASIDTTGLAPGGYTVTANVTDPKTKKNNSATCNAALTIKEPPKHPPTISCSANPTTVRSGDASTITSQATNPDNRPLTYSYNATGGHVTGTGPTATLDTAGAPAGPITVTCTVTDDRGLSANNRTTVNVEVPPPPPQASKIGEIAFPNKKKPARVDNTAKAILDDVALRLQREPDAKAVIVGYEDPNEMPAPRGKKAKKPMATLAEQRAVNTKAYLTDEKGIDPARIEVRTGTAGGKRAEIYLVPAGATFNVPDTQTFDESKVKKPPKKPVAAAHGKRHAKKPAAPKS